MLAYKPELDSVLVHFFFFFFKHHYISHDYYHHNICGSSYATAAVSSSVSLEMRNSNLFVAFFLLLLTAENSFNYEPVV